MNEERSESRILQVQKREAMKRENFLPLQSIPLSRYTNLNVIGG